MTSQTMDPPAVDDDLYYDEAALEAELNEAKKSRLLPEGDYNATVGVAKIGGGTDLRWATVGNNNVPKLWIGIVIEGPEGSPAVGRSAAHGILAAYESKRGPQAARAAQVIAADQLIKVNNALGLPKGRLYAHWMRYRRGDDPGFAKANAELAMVETTPFNVHIWHKQDTFYSVREGGNVTVPKAEMSFSAYKELEAVAAGLEGDLPF